MGVAYSVWWTISRLVMLFAILIYETLKFLIKLPIPEKFFFKDVSQDIVLITGGGNGIGRELARRFSKLASTIVLIDIRIEDLRETAKMLKIEGATSDVYIFQCDVSDRASVYSIAEKIQREVGQVTMVINNAGIVSAKKFLDLEDLAVIKTMEVNVLAHIWMCKAFLPSMMEKNHGHIVSIASLAGYSGIPQLTDYCSSKFAAVGFLKALREEFLVEGLTGIKLTIVAPYHVKTELFDGVKMLFEGCSPEDAADIILSGILTNKEEFSVPNIYGKLQFLNACLPTKVIRELKKVFGVLHCMDAFKGRTR